MKTSLFVLLFFLLSCRPQKCTNSESYKVFKTMLENEELSIDKRNEKEFKIKLLSQICNELDLHNEVLFIEEISQFGATRKGLLLMIDSNEAYSFSQKENSSIIVMKRDAGEYLPLQKVAALVQSDFKKPATKLKSIMDGKNIHDAPILQLFFFNVDKKQSQFFEFFYSPNFILENF